MVLQRNRVDAETYCKSNQMKLVSIESGYENDLIYNELVKYREFLPTPLPTSPPPHLFTLKRSSNVV